jgi:hypothetical protein
MKRRATRWPDYHTSLDMPESLSAEQLERVGRVSFMYNEAERMVDWVLFAGYVSASGMNHRLWTEVTARISGVDGKLELARKAIAYWGIEKPLAGQMEETLAAFAECKTFRDAVIHARVLDAKAGIGARLQRRAELIEVLLTADALDGLARRLLCLRNEMVAMAYIIQTARVIALDGRGISWQETGSPAEGLPDGTAPFHKYRNQRRSLPPLPAFPDPPPTPEESELN